MRLQQLPLQQRPREKLITFGAETLTDAELLAIFLRTGVPGANAIEFAHGLLLQFGGLRQLITANSFEFSAVKGLGSGCKALGKTQAGCALRCQSSTTAMRLQMARARQCHSLSSFMVPAPCRSQWAAMPAAQSAGALPNPDVPVPR